jgi:hypothetical protein
MDNPSVPQGERSGLQSWSISLSQLDMSVADQRAYIGMSIALPPFFLLVQINLESVIIFWCTSKLISKANQI